MYRSIITKNIKDSITQQYQTSIIEFTWDEDGNRVEKQSIIKPYLYYEDSNNKNPEYKSLFHNNLTKIEFDTTWERSKWMEENRNIPLFETLPPAKQYLLDKYFGQERSMEFQKYALRVFCLDIEVEIDNCFPEPANADYPINVISIYDTLTNIVHVWTYKKDIFTVFDDTKDQKIIDAIKKYDENIASIQIYKFDREVQLLQHFLKFWEDNAPDIITGWNVDKFDMIYIVNRIIKIFGDGEQNRLSPANKYNVKKPVYPIFEKPQKGVVNNNPQLVYRIQGLSICDYLNLYKKFSDGTRQSYKLDYIANLELGVGKLDYYDMGYESMQEFMRKDFPTFVQYNIIDTVLIRLLDIKLKFLLLMRNICNIGLVEYESIFQSIPYILGGLCIQARYNGVKYLTDQNRSEDNKVQNDGYEGAFVFPTKAGYYKHGIVSFDFNSLYPNIMMSLNLSPETKVGRILTDDAINQDLIDIRTRNNKIKTITNAEFKALLDKKCTLSANNVLYLKPSINFGIVPTFLDWLYSQRKAEKGKMKTNKKQIQNIEKQLSKLEKQLKKVE